VKTDVRLVGLGSCISKGAAWIMNPIYVN